MDNPDTVTQFFNDQEQWTPDNLAKFSACFNVRREEEAMKQSEEKLDRVLADVAKQITSTIPAAVRDGRASVQGDVYFHDHQDACNFQKINMTSLQAHEVTEFATEGHDGILRRLERLLPLPMRSTDEDRFKHKGLRVWFRLKRATPSQNASASMTYKYDWSSGFARWTEDVKRNLEKKRAQGPEQASAAEAKKANASPADKEVVVKPEQP